MEGSCAGRVLLCLLLGSAAEWRGAGDGVSVAVGGDDGEFAEPEPSALGVGGWLAEVPGPGVAVGEGGAGELERALLHEALPLVEAGAHGLRHGSGGAGDASGD